MSGAGLLMGVDAAAAGGGHATQSTWSVDLDGSTGDIAISGMPSPSGDLTLSIWIKSSASSPTDKGLFGRWDGAGFMLYTTGGDVYFFAGSGAESFHWTGGWSSVADGNWHHLAAVKSGTGGTIYLDGSSVATGTLGASNGTPANVGVIGTYNGRSGSHIAARVDDAGLWSSALSSGQISGIAAGSTDPSTLSPDGLWRLEEGTGTSTTDAGSGGHNGTLAAGATWSSDVPSQLA